MTNLTRHLPERDRDKPSTEQGLYHKYDVYRTDGTDDVGGKHEDCDCFVLDLTHDPAAKVAMAAYAGAIRATHPQLAKDIMVRYCGVREDAQL